MCMWNEIVITLAIIILFSPVFALMGYGLITDLKNPIGGYPGPLDRPRESRYSPRIDFGPQ